MRYYALTLTAPGGAVYQVEKSGLGFTTAAASAGATFSSLYTPWQTSSQQLIGKTNPNALNVQWDMPVYVGHEPQGGSLIRIWGLGMKCLSQAANLNPVNGVPKTFVLRAGMAKGLPLANPAQQGVIAAGQIWQAFGNWEGTEQTLDIICNPSPPPNNYGVPISWNWTKGQSLASALQQMLAQAFSSYTPSITVSSALVAPSDQKGHYRNIDAFFKYLHAYTKKLGAQVNGSDYPGVSFSFAAANVIRVTDGTGVGRSKAIAFQDLIGQPTWIDVNTILFPTAMRGDINIADEVTLPAGVLLPYALTTPNAAYPGSPAASSSAFQGSFRVTEMHHYANFRQSDAGSWNTTFKAILPPAQSAPVSDLGLTGTGQVVA